MSERRDRDEADRSKGGGRWGRVDRSEGGGRWERADTNLLDTSSDAASEHPGTSFPPSLDCLQPGRHQDTQPQPGHAHPPHYHLGHRQQQQQQDQQQKQRKQQQKQQQRRRQERFPIALHLQYPHRAEHQHQHQHHHQHQHRPASEDDTRQQQQNGIDHLQYVHQNGLLVQGHGDCPGKPEHDQPQQPHRQQQPHQQQQLQTPPLPQEEQRSHKNQQKCTEEHNNPSHPQLPDHTQSPLLSSSLSSSSSSSSFQTNPCSVNGFQHPNMPRAIGNAMATSPKPHPTNGPRTIKSAFRPLSFQLFWSPAITEHIASPPALTPRIFTFNSHLHAPLSNAAVSCNSKNSISVQNSKPENRILDLGINQPMSSNADSQNAMAGHAQTGTAGSIPDTAKLLESSDNQSFIENGISSLSLPSPKDTVPHREATRKQSRGKTSGKHRASSKGSQCERTETRQHDPQSMQWKLTWDESKLPRSSTITVASSSSSPSSSAASISNTAAKLTTATRTSAAVKSRVPATPSSPQCFPVTSGITGTHGPLYRGQHAMPVNSKAMSVNSRGSKSHPPSPSTPVTSVPVPHTAMISSTRTARTMAKSTGAKKEFQSQDNGRCSSLKTHPTAKGSGVESGWGLRRTWLGDKTTTTHTSTTASILTAETSSTTTAQRSHRVPLSSTQSPSSSTASLSAPAAATTTTSATSECKMSGSTTGTTKDRGNSVNRHGVRPSRGRKLPSIYTVSANRRGAHAAPNLPHHNKLARSLPTQRSPECYEEFLPLSTSTPIPPECQISSSALDQKMTPSVVSALSMTGLECTAVGDDEQGSRKDCVLASCVNQHKKDTLIQITPSSPARTSVKTSGPVSNSVPHQTQRSTSKIATGRHQNNIASSNHNSKPKTPRQLSASKSAAPVPHEPSPPLTRARAHQMQAQSSMTSSRAHRGQHTRTMSLSCCRSPSSPSPPLTATSIQPQGNGGTQKAKKTNKSPCSEPEPSSLGGKKTAAPTNHARGKATSTSTMHKTDTQPALAASSVSAKPVDGTASRIPHSSPVKWVLTWTSPVSSSAVKSPLPTGTTATATATTTATTATATAATATIHKRSSNDPASPYSRRISKPWTGEYQRPAVVPPNVPNPCTRPTLETTTTAVNLHHIQPSVHAASEPVQGSHNKCLLTSPPPPAPGSLQDEHINTLAENIANTTSHYWTALWLENLPSPLPSTPSPPELSSLPSPPPPAPASPSTVMADPQLRLEGLQTPPTTAALSDDSSLSNLTSVSFEEDSNHTAAQFQHLPPYLRLSFPNATDGEPQNVVPDTLASSTLQDAPTHTTSAPPSARVYHPAGRLSNRRSSRQNTALKHANTYTGSRVTRAAPPRRAGGSLRVSSSNPVDIPPPSTTSSCTLPRIHQIPGIQYHPPRNPDNQTTLLSVLNQPTSSKE